MDPLILNSALDGSGKRHVLPVLAQRKGPVTHYIVSWVGPMVGLEGCERSRPHRHSIP